MSVNGVGAFKMPPIESDFPIVTWVKTRVWPWQNPECVITGEKISARAIAYKRKTDYLVVREVKTDVDWVSEKGYILEKLKGNA